MAESKAGEAREAQTANTANTGSKKKPGRWYLGEQSANALWRKVKIKQIR